MLLLLPEDGAVSLQIFTETCGSSVQVFSLVVLEVVTGGHQGDKWN